MIVPVRYTLYSWNPPILTPEQEVEAGRQIVMTGGPAAWKRKAPYLPDRERANFDGVFATAAIWIDAIAPLERAAARSHRHFAVPF
jgi:hypothetical protein